MRCILAKLQPISDSVLIYCIPLKPFSMSNRSNMSVFLGVCLKNSNIGWMLRSPCSPASSIYFGIGDDSVILCISFFFITFRYFNFCHRFPPYCSNNERPNVDHHILMFTHEYLVGSCYCSTLYTVYITGHMYTVHVHTLMQHIIIKPTD